MYENVILKESAAGGRLKNLLESLRFSQGDSPPQAEESAPRNG